VLRVLLMTGASESFARVELRGQAGAVLQVEKSERGPWEVPVLELPDKQGSVALVVRTASGVPIAEIVAHYAPPLVECEDPRDRREWADVDVIPDSRWTVRALAFARTDGEVEVEDDEPREPGRCRSVCGQVGVVATDMRRES